MSLAHVIVDVCSDTPLQGNQLAVPEDGSALSDDQKQRPAREMNMSETVLLLPAEAAADLRAHPPETSQRYDPGSLPSRPGPWRLLTIWRV